MASLSSLPLSVWINCSIPQGLPQVPWISARYIIFISHTILLGFWTSRITPVSVILTVRTRNRGFFFHSWVSIGCWELNQALLEHYRNSLTSLLKCSDPFTCRRTLLQHHHKNSLVSLPDPVNYLVLLFLCTPEGSFGCRHYFKRKVDAIEFNKEYF